MTLILTFLAQNWRIVAIGMLAGANMVTFQLWRHAANSFSEYRTNAELVAEAQAKRAAEVIAQQEQITKETTDGWKAAVDYLHANPQRVLSRYCTGTGISLPSAGADGAGEGPVPSPTRTTEVPGSLAELEADAAEAVLALNKLQTWAEKQGAVK